MSGRDPFEAALLDMWRRMYTIHGSNLEIRVEAGTLYIEPPEAEPNGGARKPEKAT